VAADSSSEEEEEIGCGDSDDEWTGVAATLSKSLRITTQYEPPLPTKRLLAYHTARDPSGLGRDFTRGRERHNNFFFVSMKSTVFYFWDYGS
jgi:hypothetical protein